MFNLTSKEAAKLLGTSVTRVHQLIKQGVINAEKFGNNWMIDAASVDARRSSDKKVGRPKKTCSTSNIVQFILMNRTHPVLLFSFNTLSNEFVSVDEIFNPERAPMSIMSPRGINASPAALAYWWRHRSIPMSRFGIEAKLHELGLNLTYELPFKSLGLSLSDQYWLKPFGSNIDWKDINFFTNKFADSKIDTWLADVGLESPDNTSEGMLSKRWIISRNKRYLLKGGGRLSQEPYNETIATELCSRLLAKADYTPYNLKTWAGETVSSCPVFVTDIEEYIPAYYVLNSFKLGKDQSDYRRYTDICKTLGVEDITVALSKMLIVDFIMANTDRHLRNFGLIRNVETLDFRPAPIFDTGTSLWCHLDTRALATASFWCDTKPFNDDERRQLQLVEDISWLNLDVLKGFAEFATDTLEQNIYMQNRLDFIYEGISKRIDYLYTVFG